MKKNLPLPPKEVLKGGLIVISYFLLAACMQHDETLSPRNPENRTPLELNADNARVGSMAKRTFTAHLNSGNEVNPLGVISQGQGQAIFKLSKDGMSIDYKLIVANIEDVTQAHIHCGAAGVNGGVVVFLYGFNADGASVNGTLAEGTITPASIIPLPDGASCNGGLQTWEDLISRMQNGTAYVNVHTLIYRGGEIRGQIQ